MNEVLLAFQFELQEARVSVEKWEENFKSFKASWPGIPAQYAASLYASRKRWALALTNEFLTTKTGNTTAEQGMHSVGSWFSENKEHAECVERLVHYDTERHRRLKENVMRTAAKLPQRLAHIKNQRLRILTEQFSDFSLQLLETNIQEALNYKCEVVEERMCWKQSGSFRLVTRPDNNVNSILHCPCLATIHHGVACRHINRVLLFLGAPVYNTLYFHKHWERWLQHEREEVSIVHRTGSEMEAVSDAIYTDVPQEADFDVSHNDVVHEMLEEAETGEESVVSGSSALRKGQVLFGDITLMGVCKQIAATGGSSLRKKLTNFFVDKLWAGV